MVFLVTTLHQRKARLEMLEKYLKAEVEKAVVLDKLAEAMKELETKAIEESDGFLKFVSDSREWAFKYIEDLQSALEEFDKAVGPQFKYAETYASLDSESPSKDILRKISKEYSKLRQMLPNDMVN
jgi:hypothetical protein